jgi:hypothetical protein
MRIPRSLLAVLVLPAVVAGCGGDDEGDDSTTQAQTTVTQTVTVPPSTEEETTPTEEETIPLEPADPGDDGGGCTDDAGNQIQILTGDVTCDAAKEVAGNYDQQGDRVQEVGEFVCEGGNAQTRPIIFTCTGPGGEFTVSEAGS